MSNTEYEHGYQAGCTEANEELYNSGYRNGYETAEDEYQAKISELTENYEKSIENLLNIIDEYKKNIMDLNQEIYKIKRRLNDTVQ